MSNIFENFHINKLVIHKIYKRDENGIVEPTYNNVCENLVSDDLNVLENRIVKVIGQNSRAIQMDIVRSGAGTVFELICPLFDQVIDDEEFIVKSKSVTYKLVEAQTTRRIPGGVVVFFEGTTGVNSDKCIGIIKAEEDAGFTLVSKDNNLSLKFIKDLLLTKNQKFYKVSVIVDQKTSTGSRTAKDVSVFIYDSNNDTANSDAKASYFYDGFMGCTFQRNSNVLTRDFFNYTKAFIQTNTAFTGEQKIGLMSALFSYLKVNINSNFNVGEFADSYFADANIKDKYVKYLEEKKIPSTNIRKDLSMISSKLKTRKISFNNFVSISAPVDSFKHLLEIEEKDDKTLVTINGKITTES